MPSPSSKRDTLPPRLLPVLYFGFAHLSLALAFAAIAVDPRAVSGFFYHARMAAIVHLVTLGWITCSILGAIYVVGPLALRLTLPARAADYWACAFVTIGVSGMVTHFWIAAFGGMAWSAVMVALGLAHVAIRVLTGLRSAPIPHPVKLHIVLAFLNVLVAATLGLLLGFDKVYHFMPGYVLANVAAHAHLAAVGWAAMMVVGVGYRLLPMMLPSAMPTGRSVYVSAVLLETGVAGLFVSLLARSAWVSVFAFITVAGFAAFFAHVGWMRRHSRTAPVGSARPDYGVWHAMQALGYLGLSATLGVTLAFGPWSDWTLRLALVYGVCGLVGFLGQMVVGVEARVLPIFAWYLAFANAGFEGPLPSPQEMPDRSFERTTFCLWAVGIPAVAAGFFFDVAALLAAGAWILLAAAVLGAINAALVVRHAFGGRRASDRAVAPGRAFSASSSGSPAAAP